jgi:hypothetical protein
VVAEFNFYSLDVIRMQHLGFVTREDAVRELVGEKA